MNAVPHDHQVMSAVPQQPLPSGEETTERFHLHILV